MPQSRITWLCVADAGVAHIKQWIAAGARLTNVATIAHGPYEHGRFEEPGRSQESATTMRHSFVDADGPVRREKRGFAYEVAGYLNEAAQREAFHRLVLAAPPKFLGDLREAMSPALQQRIVAEIDKDLTKESDAALAARLPDAIRL